MTREKTNKEIIEKARAVISQRIRKSEKLLENLINSEPEDDEYIAYESWEDRIAEAEDWVERCHNGWHELCKLAEEVGVVIEEGEWL